MDYNKMKFNRLRVMANNRVGWIYKGSTEGGSINKELAKYIIRRPELALFDDILHNRQYDHLPEWSSSLQGSQIDSRKNQPKIIFPYAEVSTNIFNSLLTTDEARLKITSDEEDTQELIDEALERMEFWDIISDMIPSLLCNGSAFVRFYVSSRGKVCLKFINSKHVWPHFDDSGELTKVIIRKIYDTGQENEKGEKIYRWEQIHLGADVDIYYDNPVFVPNEAVVPQFTEVDRNEHGLGFVQGHWFTTSSFDAIPDGKSFIEGSIYMIDSINYRLSKEDAATYYNIFPNLVALGMDADDLKDSLPENREQDLQVDGISAIALSKPPGRSDLKFLEPSMTGMQVADQFHIRMFQLVQYSLQTTLLDPERIAAHAQSGVAMRGLFRPVISFIKKIRPKLKKGICDLLDKVEVASERYNIDVEIKRGMFSKSKKKWGDLFNDTPQDMANKVGYTVNAVTSGILSKKTATAHISEVFGVKNVEEELKNIMDDKQQEFEDQQLLSDMNNLGGQGNNEPTQQK